MERKREKKGSLNGFPSLFKEKEMVESIVAIVILLIAIAFTTYVRRRIDRENK